MLTANNPMPQTLTEVLTTLESNLAHLQQQGGSDLPQALDGLSTQAQGHLDQLLTDFDGEADGLIAALSAADQWLQAAIANVQQHAGTVQADQTALQGACAQWEQTNAELTAACSADVQNIGARLVELDQLMQGDHQAIQAAVAALLAAVQAGIGGLQQAQAALDAQFGAFDQQSVAHLAATQTALQDFMALLDQRYTDTDQLLLAETGSTLERSRELLQETAEQLAQGAAGVSQALSLFGEQGRQVGAVLDGSVGEVLDRIQEVLRLLEQIRPLLDAIDQLT